jgi:cell division GTPase FtsZ
MTMEETESEIFAIGIGECGSNLVGSYLAKSKKGELPQRIREYLVMNTDRGDLLKARKKYSISSKRTLLYSDAEIGVGGYRH